MTPTATARSICSIQANDFAAQWRETRKDALAAVQRVGNSGRLILGEEVSAFERKLADWWGVSHAVGVANGTDALEIALRCAEVGPGARVLTTPLSAFATTLAILRVGAKPVWCDVEGSGGLDLDRAAAALESDGSIAAVVAVHLYGHPLDPRRLARLCEQHGVALIEDCAQAAGAEREGAPTGTVGLAAATSFYPTKNLGALGDGGALLTMDAEVAERARRLRNYGEGERHVYRERGLNSRLDELHAAILRSAMLPRLDGWLARRRQIARRYTEALTGCSQLRPMAATGGRSAHHLYPVEAASGETHAVVDALESAGVRTGRHYPFLCCDQAAVRGGDAWVCGEMFPTARRVAEREISLPINPYLDDEQVERVIGACLQAAARRESATRARTSVNGRAACECGD